jgi:hypothetical protein
MLIYHQWFSGMVGSKSSLYPRDACYHQWFLAWLVLNLSLSSRCLLPSVFSGMVGSDSFCRLLVTRIQIVYAVFAASSPAVIFDKPLVAFDLKIDAVSLS